MKRRNRLEYAGTIFVALLFVLIVGLVDILDTDHLEPLAPGSQPPVAPIMVRPAVETPAEPDCAESETLFVAKLESSRSCQVDADCALVRFECPFECVSAVSGGLVEELRRDEQAYLRSCRHCESTCPVSLVKWRAACVRQRCIVLDRSIDELQEETLRHINE